MTEININNYNDFVTELLKAGFSVAMGGNDEGVFGLIKHGWNDEPQDSPLRWHTGDKETDPWEWRIRVLDERDDIAYSKLFFRKGGYITKEWYPYFLSVRRGGKVFEEDYFDGKISYSAKRIYDVLAESESLPLHEIKLLAEFTRDDKSKFDGALTELQMKMYITMCGTQQKLSKKGEEYGWSSTVFCTTERFFGEDTLKKSAEISAESAALKITEHIYKLNPLAVKKKIDKFIKG